MAVIRVQKTENYTVMSNHHLRNINLSLKAKGLVSLMLSLPPEWDYSVQGLVSICKESHTSVRSALKELEEHKYLIRERKNTEKGYFVYEYTLYEIPSPYTGIQHTVKRNADNGHAENRTQLNKDKLNTKELNIKELSKEINEKDFSLYTDILNSIEDTELKALYVDFIEHREQMGAPMSKRALSMLIDRCERISNFNVKVQKLLLETAIVSGWKNVFHPKDTDIKEANKEILEELKNFYGDDY